MRQILLWSLLLFACTAHAQMLNDSTLQCVSYWNLDESHVYQVVQTKDKIVDGDTLNIQSTKYKARVSVIDSTASGYSMIWHYYDYQIENGDSLMKKLLSIADEMDAVYSIDKFGVFKQLDNTLEIKEYVYQGLDSVASMYATMPGIANIVAQVKETFSTPQAIQNATIEEVLLFHRLLGNLFEAGKVYQSDVTLPSLYGGNPFDALQETEIYDVDTAESTAVIRMTTDVDKQQLTQAVKEYLIQVAQATGKEAPLLDDMPDLTMQIRYAANMHLPSGWPLYIVNIKDVSAPGAHQIDQTEITFLE